jgi:hypothetical protein
VPFDKRSVFGISAADLTARNVIVTLIGLGMAGALLFLPAVSMVGGLLAPSQPTPSTTGVPPLIGHAIWARANGGRATELQPINPFTLGRMASCHLLAERFDDRRERDAQHDDCFKLLPGLQAIGYLSSLHMQSVGVWQDARVPFVQIATIRRMSDTWTRDDVINSLAAHAEFRHGWRGVDAAARGFFARAPSELSLEQVALLAAMIGDLHLDPWCDSAGAAQRRGRVLDEMRENLAIDAAAAERANVAPLGLTTPPASHQGCK